MKAVNLLPNDLRGSSRSSTEKSVAQDEPGGPGAFVVLGVLAFCLVALVGYVLTTNSVKERRADLERVTAEAAAATQRAAQLKPYADFDALAESRVQTVRDLTASRFDWEQGLRDISRSIPASVTLTQLDGSVSSQTGGGNTLRGAIDSPAIELKGCSNTQPSVALLMSRLRNVEGVTRVSLSKSTKPDPGSTQQAAGPNGEARLCRNPRAASFEIVIFFELSEVPATVEDITTSPQPVAGEGEDGAPAAGGEATAEPASEAPAEGEAPTESTPASTEDTTS
jgi:Tfp pilus assembly protein PilN